MQNRNSRAVASKHRSRRRKKRGIFSAVFAFLCAAVIMCVIGAAVIHLTRERPVEYPVRYTSEITTAAEEYSIPAPYIAAVIMSESSYNPSAVSSVGAIGLMQIMPDTGEWIAGKYKIDFDPEMLYDPATNIYFGSWYLGFLMDRYAGDMTCATAAYHAGQGTVDKWLKNPDYSADGVTLSYIPYDSTRTYVERVLKYYDYYEAEYEKIAAE